MCCVFVICETNAYVHVLVAAIPLTYTVRGGKYKGVYADTNTDTCSTYTCLWTAFSFPECTLDLWERAKCCHGGAFVLCYFCAVLNMTHVDSLKVAKL